MKRVRQLATVLLLAIMAVGQSSTPAAVAPGARIQPRPEAHRFPNNTTLYYDGEWRLLKAGVATIRMEQAAGLQKVSATATSAGVVSLLYGVRDQFEAVFHPDTFCSERIFKHTEEGSRKLETNIRFDGARGKAILDERNLKKGNSKHQELDIPPCVTDVISGLFYMAAQPMTPGTTTLFPLNDGGQTITVKGTVEGVEQVKTGAGVFNTVRVRAESTTGKLAGRGAIWVWYTNDAQRLPVQMRSRAFWGTLTFRLTRIERK